MKPMGEYDAMIAGILSELGVERALITGRGLVLQHEADQLEEVETDAHGRIHLLTPAAATAWHAMQTAAAADGIPIHIVSAFRSVQRQVELIRNKKARGLSVEDIFALSAPPGYSEHHTGRAVDVGTEGAMSLEQVFEDTPAFGWLTAHAARFDFHLSYPRGNRYGFAYEPWHWCHTPD